MLIWLTHARDFNVTFWNSYALHLLEIHYFCRHAFSIGVTRSNHCNTILPIPLPAHWNTSCRGEKNDNNWLWYFCISSETETSVPSNSLSLQNLWCVFISIIDADSLHSKDTIIPLYLLRSVLVVHSWTSLNLPCIFYCILHSIIISLYKCKSYLLIPLEQILYWISLYVK